MNERPRPEELVRFGVFEADLEAGELRKSGRKIRVQELPFRLLAILLERPGEVVTRDELRKRLWPADIFVEFEHSLNTAIAKLRKALGDSADSPRFIETIPRHGYRFLADVNPINGTVAAPRRNVPWRIVVSSAAVLAGIAVFLAWFAARQPRPAGTPPKVVPLTTYPGSEFQPSFSPDGSAVAFVWDGEAQNNRDIYAKTIGEEKPLRLTDHPADDCCPAWSPDGRFVAFARRRQGGGCGGTTLRNAEILVIPPLGGPERKLSEELRGPAPLPHLAWSPDGQWLVFPHGHSRDEPASLYMVSIKTGKKRRLTYPSAQSLGDGGPSFSPDGRTLVFSRRMFETGGHGLYALALSERLEPVGEPLLLYSTRFHKCYSPVFTPDGRSIVFALAAVAEVGAGLHRMPASGRHSPERLAFALEADFAAISRSANRLSFSRESRRELNILRLRLSPTGAVEEKIKMISSTRLDGVPQYSPDGRRIVFTSTRSGSPQVWVCDSNGENLMQLTSAGWAGYPRWSPDGRHILFVDTREGQFDVYVVSAQGGPARRLTHDPATDGAANWSNDGRWIYFVSTRTGSMEVWKMPAGGGKARQITRHGGFAAVESPHGRFLYFSKETGVTSLRRIPVEGGEEIQVLKDVEYLSFDVRNEGIYFISPPDGNGTRLIRFLSFESGEVRDIAETGMPGEGISV